MSKVLLISTGGTVEQIRKSIEYIKPNFIIFFCSKQTYSIAKNAADPFENVKDYERIVTEDPEHLGVCYKTLITNIPKILGVWDKDFSKDVVVDYTGGTKTMAAALILATINSCSEYSYIGGNKRSKDGVGIVVDGEERHILLGNPWQELAVNELELIDQLFNKARYLSVVEKIEEIKEKVDVRLLGLYSALGDLVKGYYEWDCFRHRKSKNLIKSALAKLKNILMLVNLCDAKKFLEKVEQNFEYIENICRFMEDKSDNNELNKLLCLDLISNAIRRADKENKYDDAVARLYSAMEKFGKMYLLDKGIDNSHASPNDIPLELRDQFKKYMEEDKVKKTVYYKFGLNATLSLLSVIDPKYNQKYQGYQKQLGILMKIRNNSILAHGSEPISKDTYDKMLEFVLSFAEISKDEVVSYPEFNISLWAGLLLQK